jgi:hypothetical protein
MSEPKRAPLAADVKFLLCEDVRHEKTGKLLIVGLYPGERVVVHKAERVQGIDAEAVIPSLCLLFISDRGSGKFDSRFEITAPDGRAVANGEGGEVDLGEGKSATVCAVFRPFPVLSFGEHRVRMQLDETAYEYAFDIRQASDESSRHPSSKQQPRKKSARTGSRKKAR